MLPREFFGVYLGDLVLAHEFKTLSLIIINTVNRSGSLSDAGPLDHAERH